MAAQRPPRGARSERDRRRRSLGQNFLSDDRHLRRFLDGLGPIDDDLVVDLGAGRGALTLPLAELGARVWAVEIDRSAGIGTYTWTRIDGFDFGFSYDRVAIDYAGGFPGVRGWHGLRGVPGADMLPTTTTEIENNDFNCFACAEISIAKMRFFDGDVLVLETDWVQHRVEFAGE